jgi:hypothetical protein
MREADGEAVELARDEIGIQAVVGNGRGNDQTEEVMTLAHALELKDHGSRYG